MATLPPDGRDFDGDDMRDVIRNHNFSVPAWFPEDLGKPVVIECPYQYTTNPAKANTLDLSIGYRILNISEFLKNENNKVAILRHNSISSYKYWLDTTGTSDSFSLARHYAESFI